MEIYLEVGTKKVFAGLIQWPGLCRSGRDDASAVQALIDYGPRYAQALAHQGLSFSPPTTPGELTVVERLTGDGTTDFGAPSQSPSCDADPLDAAELQRQQQILVACWQALEQAAQEAAGKELRKGPRGGGRELLGMIEHVFGAEQNYLSALGWKRTKTQGLDLPQALASFREDAVNALAAAARGDLSATGPRGGARWRPRYYVRRSAWHILDHVWEIQDRTL